MERVGKQRARLGRDAKNTFFFLSPHTPYGRARLARFACLRLLRHALPISLLILRKKPTVLQSNLPRKYFFMGRYVTRFKLTFLPFAVNVILNYLSINNTIRRQRKMAPLTSAIGPFMSFLYDICGDWSDVMVEVDGINGETSPTLFEQECRFVSPWN